MGDISKESYGSTLETYVCIRAEDRRLRVEVVTTTRKLVTSLIHYLIPV